MIRSRTFRSAMLALVAMSDSTAWLLRRAERDYGPEVVPAEWIKNSMGWCNCWASWRQHWPHCAPRSTLRTARITAEPVPRLEDDDARRLGHLRPGSPHPPRESGGRCLQKGSLNLIPDCGHLTHVEYPDHFVATLDRFLSEQTSH